MTPPANSYTAEHITVLKGLEPVRRRPGMYIGGTDTKGYHHLLWEIVDNSVDEVINGYATHIEVDPAQGSPLGDRDRQRPRHSGRHQEGVQEVGARAGADHLARRRQVLFGPVPVLGRSARRGLVGGERAVRGDDRAGQARRLRVGAALRARRDREQADQEGAPRGAPALPFSFGRTRRSSASRTSPSRPSVFGWRRRPSCTRGSRSPSATRRREPRRYCSTRAASPTS